jgi:L,D-peptidoglycan transpeptidase YkuD (ErfK/YbiS/YcfS/YnhG family)
VIDMERALLVVIGLLAALSCKKADKQQAASPIRRCQQLVTVRSPDWTSPAGTLQRYERKSRSDPWLAVGASVPVTLGRAGMGWGRGAHGEQARTPKKEGDGRSPAGLFLLKSTFGEGPDQPGNLPYTQVTQGTLCIDDPKSLRYNRIVGPSEVQYPDWGSARQLKRSDERYRIAVVIGHNTEPVQSGAGSCAFLHVRTAAEPPTDDGTALDADALMTIARWLDWMAEPTLVQLPDSEYVRWKPAWGLP